jgi:hypothetical protein
MKDISMEMSTNKKHICFKPQGEVHKVPAIFFSLLKKVKLVLAAHLHIM